MASRYLSKDDTWQTILANELMEKSAITPRTLSILKDDHEYCDPNVLMNLRHEKSANRKPKKPRESLSNIMETARRNLKTEYNKKVSGAMHKKIIQNEVEKFKQNLAMIKRINAASNRSHLARKPLRIRFQRIAIRSRSCGSSVVKPRRNKDPEFKSFNEEEFNLPVTSDTFFDIPQTLKSQWKASNPSVDSLFSDMSLPAVYGNCMSGFEIPQKGPNTTPISFCSGNFLGRSRGTETKKAESSSKEDFFPGEFCEDSFLPSSPETPAESSAIKEDLDHIEPSQRCGLRPQSEHSIIDDGNAEDNVQGTTKIQNDGSYKNDTLHVNYSSDVKGNTEESKRKVKNSAYKQFMSYVCNKSIRTKPVHDVIPGSTKLVPKVQDEEKAIQREEKIALVLSYLQRKKNSPESSHSVTPPEPVTRAKTKITPMPEVSLDPKTVRANGGPYENRFQAQRDVIKRQKMQLEEQQKKIQELTLAKLQEEAKNSQKEFQKTIDELEEDCTLSIRPQLKTLQGIGSRVDFFSAGKIVERMEKRAKEREEKRQIAAERRKLLEEERKKKILEEEETRRKEEDEKKRKAFEKIREENIRQREIRERTRKEQEKMLQLHRRAETYNERRLYKAGLQAFKQLLVRRDNLFEMAEEYYTKKTLKRAFLNWKFWIEEKAAQKLAIADDFYKSSVLRRSFNSWKKEMTDTIRKRQVAEDMYDLKLQERVFRKWSQIVNEQHLQMAEKLETAHQYYTWVLLKKAFHRWRAYPKIAHLEREKEQRKMVLRQKVQDMLPDFRPFPPHY